jgi:hypothetical protein
MSGISSSTSKQHLLSLMALVLLVVIAFGSVGTDVTKEEEEAARKIVTEHYNQMARLYELIAAEDRKTWENIKCDKTLMAERLGLSDGGDISLPPFYYPQLERFSLGTKEAWDKDMGKWQQLTDKTVVRYYRRLQDLTPVQLTTLAEHWVPRIAEHRFVLIILPSTTEMLQWPALRPDGEGFNGGLLIGWFLVADLLEGEIVCRNALFVTSSERVRNIFTDIDDALDRDFRERFEKAISEELPNGVRIRW